MLGSFSRALVLALPSLLRSREPTLSSNQFEFLFSGIAPDRAFNPAIMGCMKRSSKPVVAKNPIQIESIDVGAVPLVSSRSHVQSVCFRFDHPRFVFPDSGRFTIGDPCSAPPDQCAAKVATCARSTQCARSLLVGTAAAAVVRLAFRADHRQAGNGHRLAPPGIPPLLDLEE